jgi:hypothetical protein
MWYSNVVDAADSLPIYISLQVGIILNCNRMDDDKELL